MNDYAEAITGGDYEGINIAPYLDGIEERGEEGRRVRRLSAQTMADLKAAGFIRSLLPKNHGGLAVSPQAFFRAQMEIAERDMSAAWVGGVVAVHAFQLALMSRQARDEVYAAGPDVCISSSYNPVGAKVEPCDGGFMLSGRWGWSSGADHCSWALLGGIVKGEGYRTFLVPGADYRIEDTWFAMGLQGTGSNDIVIEEPVFVPDYRTHKRIDGFLARHEQDDPIYSIPWAQFFVRVVSTPAIGAARRALRLFRDNAASSSTDPTKLQTDPDITRRVAEAANIIDETELVLFRNFDAMMDCVSAGREIPMIDRVKYRYQASLVIEKMIKVVDMLFDVAGGRSVFTGAPIQNIWHDIHIARAHVANNHVGFARNYGGMYLGAENQDQFV